MHSKKNESINREKERVGIPVLRVITWVMVGKCLTSELGLPSVEWGEYLYLLELLLVLEKMSLKHRAFCLADVRAPIHTNSFL